MSLQSQFSGHYHVKVCTVPLDFQQAFSFVQQEQQGAVSSFIGTVRNKNIGRDVDGLEYDAQIPLAEKVFADLCCEALQRWGEGLRLWIEHYKGPLPLGGVAVVIFVSAPHREEAIQACRFCIEEIKKRAPVWKCEHYLDGTREWVPGHSLRGS